MVAEVDHPKAGPIRIIGSPLNFSDSKLRPYAPPPVLGQHTEAILRDKLGYSEEQITAMRKAGAIGAE